MYKQFDRIRGNKRERVEPFQMKKDNKSKIYDNHFPLEWVLDFGVGIIRKRDKI